MDHTKNFSPEMKACVNRDIYNQENDDLINASVDQMHLELVDEFQRQEASILEKNDKLNCEDGKSYVRLIIKYNLITKLLEDLLSEGDLSNKEALRDMLDSDIADLIYGPPSDEELNKSDQDRIFNECDIAKQKIREAIKEFVDSSIHSDREMQYFATLNVMVVAIKEVVNIFTPDVGPHEFCGYLTRLGNMYHACHDMMGEMPKNEDGELVLTKENMKEVLKVLREAVKKVQ